MALIQVVDNGKSKDPNGMAQTYPPNDRGSCKIWRLYRGNNGERCLLGYDDVTPCGHHIGRSNGWSAASPHLHGDTRDNGDIAA
jgi:hypothetical protein